MGRLSQRSRSVVNVGDKQYPTIWEYAETKDDEDLAGTVSCLKATTAKSCLASVLDDVQSGGAIKTYQSMQNSIQLQPFQSKPECNTHIKGSKVTSYNNGTSVESSANAKETNRPALQHWSSISKQGCVAQGVQMYSQQGCIERSIGQQRMASASSLREESDIAIHGDSCSFEVGSAFNRGSLQDSTRVLYGVDRDAKIEPLVGSNVTSESSNPQMQFNNRDLNSPISLETRRTQTAVEYQPPENRKYLCNSPKKEHETMFPQHKGSVKAKKSKTPRPLVYLPSEHLIDKSADGLGTDSFEEAKNAASLLFRSRSSIYHKPTKKLRAPALSEKQRATLGECNAVSSSTETDKALPQKEKIRTRLSGIFSTGNLTQKNVVGVYGRKVSKNCAEKINHCGDSISRSQDAIYSKSQEASAGSDSTVESIAANLSLTMEEFLFENAQQVEELEPSTNMSIGEFLLESKAGTQSVAN